MNKNNYTAKEWQDAPKKIMKDFEGSVWEQTGHENKICPICQSPLHDGICLNGCHLGSSGKERFSAFLRISNPKTESHFDAVMDIVKILSPIKNDPTAPTGRGLDDLTEAEMHVLHFLGQKGGRAAGSFTNALIDCLFKAVGKNFAILHDAFPEYGEAVRRWQLGTFPGYESSSTNQEEK